MDGNSYLLEMRKITGRMGRLGLFGGGGQKALEAMSPGALSSIAALPAIVDAVGDQIEIHLDGGIRSGQDVLKSLKSLGYEFHLLFHYSLVLL